jgi:hypothetical protein
LSDVAALTSSKLAGVNRQASQRIYERLRRRVVEMAMAIEGSQALYR